MCPSDAWGDHQSPAKAATRGLFHGVERAVAETLGIRNYRHKSAVDEVCRQRGGAGSYAELADVLFALCESNWPQNIADLSRKPSRQNWRWFDPKERIAKCNQSPEVTLERALVRACTRECPGEWSNQVPIASGLAGLSGGRRAIDLVHRRDVSAFDFVELKVSSDNPVYAAVEIVLYGLIWLLSRRHRAALGYAGNPLIEAHDIRLSVLAPSSFYRQADWSWLSVALDDGLRSIGRQNDGIELRFSFEEFAPEFHWPADFSAPQLIRYFEARRTR